MTTLDAIATQFLTIVGHDVWYTLCSGIIVVVLVHTIIKRFL
jgi:hypothetical protein